MCNSINLAWITPFGSSSKLKKQTWLDYDSSELIFIRKTNMTSLIDLSSSQPKTWVNKDNTNRTSFWKILTFKGKVRLSCDWPSFRICDRKFALSWDLYSPYNLTKTSSMKDSVFLGKILGRPNTSYKTLQSKKNSWNQSMTKELVGFQSFELPTYMRALEIDFWTRLMTKLALHFLSHSSMGIIKITFIFSEYDFLYAKWKMVLGFSISGLFPTTSPADSTMKCHVVSGIKYTTTFPF